MSKNDNGNTARETPSGGPRLTTLAGGALLLLGLGGLYYNKTHQGLPDWFWYTAVTVAALGGLTWWLGTMPREHAIEWIKSGLFALTLALLIRWPIAEPYRIPSNSMYPTLIGDPRLGRGDRVFVNKWIYGVRYPFMNKRIWHGADPQRWDIVVFKTVEPDAEHPTLVKRIVGLPGERIHIADGKVFVNGKALEIPDFMPDDMYYTTESGTWLSPVRGYTDKFYGISGEDEFSVVPEGHYLVLGDNSSNSRDGRWFGWLPNENIVGRVACIWWPPSSWRDFTGFTKTLWWRGLLFLLGLWVVTRLFLGRSWAAYAADGKTVDHYCVSFIGLGLRLPFSRLWLLRWGNPDRGDLVLYFPAGQKTPDGEALFGRIAGLPGETVNLEGGVLAINGATLQGVPTLAGPYAESEQKAVYGVAKRKDKNQVPEGHYFILCEPANDAEAMDSRSAGWIPSLNIAGKATRVWWPLSRCRGTARLAD